MSQDKKIISYDEENNKQYLYKETVELEFPKEKKSIFSRLKDKMTTLEEDDDEYDFVNKKYGIYLNLQNVLNEEEKSLRWLAKKSNISLERLNEIIANPDILLALELLILSEVLEADMDDICELEEL